MLDDWTNFVKNMDDIRKNDAIYGRFYEYTGRFYEYTGHHFGKTGLEKPGLEILDTILDTQCKTWLHDAIVVVVIYCQGTP